MDVSFHESEPYYSGDVSKHSLKGENSSEENKFQDGGNNSFIELDEVHKFFTENNEQGCGKFRRRNVLEMMINKVVMIFMRLKMSCQLFKRMC